MVAATLSFMGIDVLNAGFATTPTVEVAVTTEKADGGIILTASHNPAQWNALKLLNDRGEFLSAEDGESILRRAREDDFNYAEINNLGAIKPLDGIDIQHIRDVVGLKLVDVEKIKAKKFRVAIDCVNSVGGIILPQLLKALGVDDVVELYCEPNGIFPHNPEPLPENLTEFIVSFGVWDHFRSMMRGLFRLQDAVWFASMILICLIGTSAVLSAKRS